MPIRTFGPAEGERSGAVLLASGSLVRSLAEPDDSERRGGRGYPARRPCPASRKRLGSGCTTYEEPNTNRVDILTLTYIS